MKNYKYLTLLICSAAVLAVIANTIAGKITTLGFLTLSAGSLCIPFTYIIGDTITEVYGYKHARRTTWIVVGASLMTALFYQLAILLPPAPGFTNNEAFEAILSIAPRVAIGALAAIFVGQFINDYVLAKMKIWTNGTHLWSRTIGSTVAAQGVDSFLFYVIALYNVIPSGLLIQAIASAWFVKVLIEIVITPITYIVVKRLKRLESVDYYDRNTKFTPFIFN